MINRLNKKGIAVYLGKTYIRTEYKEYHSCEICAFNEDGNEILLRRKLNEVGIFTCTVCTIQLNSMSKDYYFEKKVIKRKRLIEKLKRNDIYA